MYERFPIDRHKGLVHVHTVSTALHQLDQDQNSDDPATLLDVLARKVATARSHSQGQLEASVRDIFATAQRLLEKVVGRKVSA
jgi:hypothetical protein